MKRLFTEEQVTFEGRYYRMEAATCAPKTVQQPHPPILIGGGGERKTLRLVAQYADGCNVFGDVAHARHLMDVLEGHCADVGLTPRRSPRRGSACSRSRRRTRRPRPKST